MLLEAVAVKKAFGTDEILTGVTFRVDRKEKLALVGRNGCGKTTLLRILTGQYEPDLGTIQFAKGIKIGYLRQEIRPDNTNTVIEEAQAGRKEALELEKHMRELELKIENGATDDELEEYAVLHERFIEAEGYSAHLDVKVVLQKMGFGEDDLDKPTSALSGGETTRLALARLLLEEPDLLILDEPTNHLDLQATEWLEGWIRGYPGAVLLVSHDRRFLDNTAERVIEMRGGQTKSYPASFEKYLKLKDEETARLIDVAKRQQQEIDKLDEFVRRFMNSQRTAQARGRLKHMEKLVASKVQAPKQEKGIQAGFKKVARSGDIAIEWQAVTMAYGQRTLFKDVDWTVRYRDRWGVIGDNGAGKSTLVRIGLGLISPIAGLTRVGSNVSVGYFSQDVTELNPDTTPLRFLMDTLGLLPEAARTLLGRFLISGDDSNRPIGTLSGGEKNKLVLARLTAQNPNLLILDEPTNHLDMASREALAEVLQEYDGTLILVSHDRWLLEQVTEQTLDLKRTGPIFFGGSYKEYRDRESVRKPASPSQHKAAIEPEKKPTLSQRDVSKEIQRLTRVVADLETQIEDSEAHLKEIEDRLSNVPPHADVLDLTQDYAAIKEKIEGLFSAWTEKSQELEGIRSLQGP